MIAIKKVYTVHWNTRKLLKTCLKLKNFLIIKYRKFLFCSHRLDDFLKFWLSSSTHNGSAVSTSQKIIFTKKSYESQRISIHLLTCIYLLCLSGINCIFKKKKLFSRMCAKTYIAKNRIHLIICILTLKQNIPCTC